MKWQNDEPFLHGVVGGCRLSHLCGEGRAIADDMGNEHAAGPTDTRYGPPPSEDGMSRGSGMLVQKRASTVRSLTSATGLSQGGGSEAGFSEGTRASGVSFPMDDAEIAERSASFKSRSVQRLWLSGM